MNMERKGCLALLVGLLVQTGLQGCSSGGNATQGYADGTRQNRLLMYMDAVEYFADNIHDVRDVYKQTTTLLDLSNQGSRLFLYIDRSHCTSCWKKDIEAITNLADKPECIQNIAVLASGFLGRELDILRQTTGLDIYNAGIGETLPNALRKFSLPFFFVLTQDGKVILPYYPSHEDDEKFLRNYLALAESRMEKTHVNTQSRPSRDAPNIVVDKENLDIGEVRIRRKASGEFALKNVGSTDCEIHQIYSTCSCVLIDEYPKVIKAGKTSYVRFTTVQTTKGAFHHSIRVKISPNSENYALTFHGVCR